MDKEISQEAKVALANTQRRRALDRLHCDGAESLPALQRRVRAVAAERSIPPADYAKLMHKRVSTAAFAAFCEKHDLSCDWLLYGDLNGLQRMTRDYMEKVRNRPATARESLIAKYRSLTPDQQRTLDEIVGMAWQMLKERQP